MTDYTTTKNLSGNGLDPTSKDEVGFCANMINLGYNREQSLQAYKYLEAKLKRGRSINFPASWAQNHVEKGYLKFNVPDHPDEPNQSMASVVSDNRLWATSLATRWANLEQSRPDAWEREMSARRQLKAAQSEIRFYAEKDYKAISYAKAEEKFQAEVKQQLKEMGFGT